MIAALDEVSSFLPLFSEFFLRERTIALFMIFGCLCQDLHDAVHPNLIIISCSFALVMRIARLINLFPHLKTGLSSVDSLHEFNQIILFLNFLILIHYFLIQVKLLFHSFIGNYAFHWLLFNILTMYFVEISLLLIFSYNLVSLEIDLWKILLPLYKLFR